MESIIKKERLRGPLGRFVKEIPNGWKSKQSIYQKEYIKSHPWVKNWLASKGRAKKKGWRHTLSVEYFKTLWYEHHAYAMKSPSIDRIDSNKGYIEGNCRFIERSLNSRLGNLGLNKIKVCPNCGWHNK